MPDPPLEITQEPRPQHTACAEVSLAIQDDMLNDDGELKCLDVAKEDFEIGRINTELSQIRQALVERTELHFLRKLHSWLLCGLLMVWVITVWCALALQGFGHIPFLSPRIQFQLSDTVLIAFITSTTASMLGLYGIAAYWLFGKPKKTVTDDIATGSLSNPGARKRKP